MKGQAARRKDDSPGPNTLAGQDVRVGDIVQIETWPTRDQVVRIQGETYWLKCLAPGMENLELKTATVRTLGKVVARGPGVLSQKPRQALKQPRSALAPSPLGEGTAPSTGAIFATRGRGRPNATVHDAEIIRLAKRGLSLRAIAEELEVSKDTVWRRLAELREGATT